MFPCILDPSRLQFYIFEQIAPYFLSSPVLSQFLAVPKDTKFIAQYVDGRPAAQITSQRYKALGRQPLFRLLLFALASIFAFYIHILVYILT